MPTPFSAIPGAKGTLLDGGLRRRRNSTQDRIILVGPATDGPTNELVSVYQTSTVEAKFGSESALCRGMHEALGEGADNIRLMRSGGTPASIVITDSEGATLTLSFERRDNETLSRYALLIENDGTDNRFLVYDLEDSTYVYDSLSVLVLDSGAVEVVDTGLDLFTLNDRTDLTTAVDLSVLATGDFTVDGTATLASVTPTAGTDGTSPSLVERYAAYSTSYFLLDYKDGDIIVPLDAYLDDENIAEDASVATYGYYWLGVPEAASDRDKLGYLWQYVYQGRIYTYFVDTADYFSVTPAAATITVATDLDIDALKDGVGGNACTITLTAGGAASASVSVNDDGGIDIVGIYQTGVTTTSVMASTINAALLAGGYNTLLQASGAATAIAGDVATTNLATGDGGHVLTPTDLTGDSIPSAVSAKFTAGTDAQLREVNFAHQLASHCYLSSENWKMLLGVIPTKAPTAYSRVALASHVGSLPEYTEADTYSYIDAPADNGTGLLGVKLLAGKSKTSDGYRSALVTDGDSTDSYAYGGIILTKGESLPNGSTWPYGIDGSDEALDSRGEPVDIGRYIWVVPTWPILNNGFNGGSSYRGSTECVFAAKLAQTPAYKEPIGEANGELVSVSGVPKIHSTQVNALSELRYTVVRQEDGSRPIITRARTAAHPDSDFSKGSTIRCINVIMDGLRDIGLSYQGEPMDAQRLAAIQSDIDLYLYQKGIDGFHQGARAALRFTRAQKVMGHFDIVVRMVPPFAIESMLIEMSVAADESEL